MACRAPHYRQMSLKVYSQFGRESAKSGGDSCQDLKYLKSDGISVMLGVVEQRTNPSTTPKKYLSTDPDKQSEMEEMDSLLDQLLASITHKSSSPLRLAKCENAYQINAAGEATKLARRGISPSLQKRRSQNMFNALAGGKGDGAHSSAMARRCRRGGNKHGNGAGELGKQRRLGAGKQCDVAVSGAEILGLTPSSEG
ncbi:hypothetical protein C8R44DRAFT_724411 [Mycena epipterygia]|nr:hypothetical protein C8R44DRAFT_724411 [Mycena epipterygia]